MPSRINCDDIYNVLVKLLSRYFDPFEEISASEYLEIARSLLDLYRCEKMKRLDRQEHEKISDTLAILSKLIRLSKDVVVEKYRNIKYREKLREYIRLSTESEIKILQDYIKQGLQIAGLNIPSLAPFIADKIFLSYIGTTIKLSALITLAIKKHWSQREIRKFSVHMENIANEVLKKTKELYEDYDESKRIIGNITEKSLNEYYLEELTKRLYQESIYSNTPEVIALATELQKLRQQLLKIK
ncbi:MAG: hypothetical protein NXY59_08905 [Aigarchaeota archaeon]|nr:hypothetical protein [Candidatus Pelearchaeum maunauluense]